MMRKKLKDHAQISDYVSSYRGALEETDGTTYWLLSHGGRESGLRIDHALFDNGLRYRLSFDVEKISGDFIVMGGRLEMGRNIRVSIDGEIVTCVWEYAPVIPQLNDGNRHRVELEFTVVEEFDIMMNNFLYLIPNQGLNEGYNVLISNLHLDVVK